MIHFDILTCGMDDFCHNALNYLSDHFCHRLL